MTEFMWKTVEPSRYHQGQMCYPEIEVRRYGGNMCQMRWRWIDVTGGSVPHWTLTPKGDFYECLNALPPYIRV